MSFPRPCVIISSDPGHDDLIERLLEQGKYKVITWDILSKGHETFADHVTQVVQSVAADTSVRRPLWAQAIHELANAKRRFQLSGMDLSPSVSKVLGAVSASHLQGLVGIPMAFVKIHRETPIRAIVVHNDVTPFLRCLIRVADQFGVPSLHLPHGIPGSRMAVEDFDDLIRTTVVGVHGRPIRDWYLRNPKNREDQIQLVGRPQWDSSYDANPVSREEARERLGLPLEAKVLGLAGSWAGDLTTCDTYTGLKLAVRRFLEGIRLLEDRAPTLIVRPHPGHKYLNNFGPAWFQEIASEAGMEIMIPDVPPEVFIAASDLVAGFQSNFLVSAILAHRLALTLDVGQIGAPEGSIFANLPGIAATPMRPEAIANAVSACLYDEQTRHRLERGREETLSLLNEHDDGRSTERVLALLDRLCGPPARGAEGDLERTVFRWLERSLPAQAKRILIVGPRSAAQAAWILAEDPSREVISVRPAHPSADTDRPAARFQGDIATLDLPFPPGFFDVLVYDEVLENLADPVEVLARHRALLATTGELLVSTANAIHGSALREFLSSKGPGGDAGGLEPPRQRFTRRRLTEILLGAGYEVTKEATIDRDDVPVARNLGAAMGALGICNPEFAAQTQAFLLLSCAVHARVPTMEAQGAASADGAFSIVLAYEGDDQLEAWLSAYVTAFREGDGTVLQVLAPSTETLFELIAALLERMGEDPDHIPDVTVEHVQGSSDLAGALKTADLVLGSGHLALAADAMGIATLSWPDVEAFENIRRQRRKIPRAEPDQSPMLAPLMGTPAVQPALHRN